MFLYKVILTVIQFLENFEFEEKNLSRDRLPDIMEYWYSRALEVHNKEELKNVFSVLILEELYK